MADSEVKHTPGPWDMACDSYGKVQHSRKYDCVFTTLKGEKGDRTYVVAARIESGKDALLIAAAPDMLAALKSLDLRCMADVLNPCWDNRPTDIAGEHWGGVGKACPACNGRAAIAKAVSATWRRG